jgi:hypothetical protein
MLLLFAFLAYVLLRFWPAADAAAVETGRFFGIPMNVFGTETRWFVLVMAAGALGSFNHVVSSAADYIGTRRLVRSWIYWYLLRLPLGSGLALLVYLLLRGGILTGIPITVPLPDDQQPYGIIGISALTGMFAKKASNKLGEIFDVLFKTQRDAELSDKIAGSPPVLERIDPESCEVVPGESQMITLHGKNFQSSTQVKIDGVLHEATVKTDTVIEVTLKPEELAAARTISVQVETPSVVDGASGKVPLLITIRPDLDGGATTDPEAAT